MESDEKDGRAGPADSGADTATTDNHGPGATAPGAGSTTATSRLVDHDGRAFARAFLAIGPKPDIVEAVALWSLAGGFVTAFAEENRELVRDVDQFGKAYLVLYPNSPIVQAARAAIAIADDIAALLSEDDVAAMTKVLRP